MDLKESLISLSHKVSYLFLGLIIFRLGINIPLFGINVNVLNQLDIQYGQILESLNLFTGGALNQASVFSLAVMPYITAAIFIQILSHTNPTLKRIKNSGHEGTVKIARITRIATVLIAAIQGLYLTQLLYDSYGGVENFLIIEPYQFFVMGTLSLIAGSVFITWCGEQITERGIGNGISFFIYIGILSGIPNLIRDFQQINFQNNLLILVIIAFMISLIFIAVYIEKTQKRIRIHMTKLPKNAMNLENQYIPMKVNLSGIMPVIIAGVFVSFPVTVLGLLYNIFPLEFINNIRTLFSPTYPFYYVFIFVFIVFFSFMYLRITNFKSNIMTMIQSKGIIIDSIRPGKKTDVFIQYMINKLTILAALYLFVLIVIPDIFSYIGFSFYFGGTALLIVVMTSLEWIKQIKAHFEVLKYKKIEQQFKDLL